jgi:hypothetical protein
LVEFIAYSLINYCLLEEWFEFFLAIFFNWVFTPRTLLHPAKALLAQERAYAIVLKQSFQEESHTATTILTATDFHPGHFTPPSVLERANLMGTGVLDWPQQEERVAQWDSKLIIYFE